MTGQGLSPARMDTAPQLPNQQVQASPRRGHEELSLGCCRGDHDRGNTDVVDAEADVVDTLLTMRELASNTSGNDRVLQIAASAQGHSRRESAEDDQGARRSDSAAAGPIIGSSACASRDPVSTHRNTLNVGQIVQGLGSRPNSGVATNTLASRPNSFTGKKRKTGVNDEEPANTASPSAPFPNHYDSRETGSLITTDAAAARQVHNHLSSMAAAAEALAWRQGQGPPVGVGGGGSSGATLPLNIGRVSSEPLINGGQRLPEEMLARLGLGVAAGDVMAMERLRAMVLGPAPANDSATDPAPSAKRPHVLSRQISTASAAAGAAAPSLSSDDPQQHQNPLGSAVTATVTTGAAAATTLAAAGERAPSGRQERMQGPHHGGGVSATVTVKLERGGEDLANMGAGLAAGGGGSGESPGADHVTNGSGSTAAAAPPAAAVGGAAARSARRGARPTALRCTPPSPLRHHSDTGSDSGSPVRVPYSPASRTHMTLGPEHQQQMPGRGGGGGGAAVAAAAAAAAASDGGDDTTAPRRTTSSVISLLHTLVIHQEQQRQQQEQQRYGRGPGGRDQERERERVPIHNAQELLNDPRMAAVAAAMAAAGYSADGGAGPNGSGKTTAPQSRGGGSGAASAAACGGGGNAPSNVGSSTLHREVSHGSRDAGGGATGGVDLAQLRLSDVRQLLNANAVQTDSAPPPALLRAISGMGEAQAFIHSAAAARSAAAATAGAAPERSAMDVDVPLSASAAAAAQGSGLPHKTVLDSDRIHASLAAIERKLLLQEERLVYELKQVRLMQKLLQVQQMKQMVREAMRGKDREAAVAAAMAAGVGVGSEGLAVGGASAPFPTAAALAEGGEGSGPARLSSFPSQVLAAAARAMAAGGAAAGAFVRDRDRSGAAELLRSASEAAAAAAAPAAASLQAGLADHPNPTPPHYQSNPPAKQSAHSQSQSQQRRGHAAAAEASADADNNAVATDEAWSLLGPDSGHLLSYIAAISGNKTTPAALTAAMAAAARREAAGPVSTTAVAGGLGASELGVAMGLLDAAGHGPWQRDSGAAAAAAAARKFGFWSRGAYDDLRGSATGGSGSGGGGGGGVPTAAEALASGALTEEGQALVQMRILQALLRQQHPQHQQHGIQDHVMTPSDCPDT
ncbi:hypothetical protein VaNZ11_005412 [Volvox africanus]|uniref:Uncharacterized protein n=1 Tax=Volvox africanus TaxID=51714 RepID=A0ABQ5RZA1_9CHLO|nr:hypothetical protein VaNZ11_005412 [Volvox africanus]